MGEGGVTVDGETACEDATEDTVAVVEDGERVESKVVGLAELAVVAERLGNVYSRKAVDSATQSWVTGPRSTAQSLPGLYQRKDRLRCSRCR